MAVIEVWSRAKVEKHLKRYNKVGGRHYAHTDENSFEMYARKVALLQVLKYMPASIELANAITVSNAVEENKGVVIEGDFVHVGSVDPDTGEITDTGSGGGRNLAAAKLAIDAAGDSETAGLVLDEARSELSPPDYEALTAHYRARWSDQKEGA